MCIHSNDNLPAQIPTNHLDNGACTRVDLAPRPRPKPHRSSCEARLGRENSILARQQGSAERDQPIRSMDCMCVPHRGPLAVGYGEINTLTWLAMTRLPAALRNLVKLVRRRGVALVMVRRAKNVRREQLPSRHPEMRASQSSTSATIGAGCQAAEPRWPHNATVETVLGLR